MLVLKGGYFASALVYDVVLLKLWGRPFNGEIDGTQSPLLSETVEQRGKNTAHQHFGPKIPQKRTPDAVSSLAKLKQEEEVLLAVAVRSSGQEVSGICSYSWMVLSCFMGLQVWELMQDMLCHNALRKR